MLMGGYYRLPDNFMGAEYMIQIQQYFPLSRVRGHRAEQEEAVARAESSSLDVLILDRELAARLAFVDLWAWDRTIDSIEHSLPLVRAAVDVARARYRAGTAGQGDIYRAEAELAGLRATWQTAKENRTAIVAALLASMGVAPENLDAVHLQLAAPPEIPTVPPLAQLFDVARKRRPELRRAQAGVEEAVAAGEAARSEYVPEAQVQLGYMPTTMPGGVDSYQALVGLSVPLVGLAGHQGAVAEAEARERAGRLDAASQWLEIQREIAVARAALSAAIVSREALEKDVLPRAQAAAEAVFASYSSGGETVSSLIDAQRALITVRLQLEQARADVFRKHALLLRAVGGKFATAD